MWILSALFWFSWCAIAYTYIIFPLLLALIARIARGRRDAAVERHLPDPPDLPRVAMVVAAYNEEGVIATKLENTWGLDYPADRFELLVGSDGSSDATAALLAHCKDPRLKAFAFSERRGKISVLNDLLQQVDADIVVMSDANTIFAPDAVKLLVQHFADPTVGCVSGELGLDNGGGVSGEGLYWRYEGWIKRNESRLGFLIGSNGGIFAIRRELYRPLPASTVVEDFVITMQVLEQGYNVRFEPAARAMEPACPSARAEMIRKIRIGAGGFQALGLTGQLLHPRYGLRAFAFWGHKVLRWLVPLFCVVALGANVGLLGVDLYRVLFLGQLAGAALAGWAYHATPAAAPPRWSRPVTYFYLMNYALLCGFLRFLLRTQRVTWDRATR